MIISGRVKITMINKQIRIYKLDIQTSQKQAAYEHSGAEGTRSVISRSLLLRPKAAVKAPLDI